MNPQIKELQKQLNATEQTFAKGLAELRELVEKEQLHTQSLVEKSQQYKPNIESPTPESPKETTSKVDKAGEKIAGMTDRQLMELSKDSRKWAELCNSF